MASADAAAQIATFLNRYSPKIAAELRVARRELRRAFPRGHELVFDNYNALVFAISPSQRASDAFVSVAGYPSWVTLFFLRGAQLPDPLGLLEGTGKQVRSVRLSAEKTLRSPGIKALLKEASRAHTALLKLGPKLDTTVKMALEKRRPRRAASKPASAKAGKKSLKSRPAQKSARILNRQNAKKPKEKTPKEKTPKE